MSKFVVIDGGTTNTRVMLSEDEKLISKKKIPAGAGSDNSKELPYMIKAAISELFAECGISESQAEAVLLSGMITSEKGLFELAHIKAPAGIAELHDGMKKEYFNNICSLPFYFIPGVKILGKTAMDSDMMRGEESEIFGFDTELSDAVTVLPGSHSKLICTDKIGKIVKITTMLTGEMIASLSAHTVLRSAVNLENSRLCENSLCNGYFAATEHGLNEALFKVRIMKNLFGASDDEIYSFFLGAVMSAEIVAIERENAKNVYIGGKESLRHATAVLLRNGAKTKKNVYELSDSETENANLKGMIRIYKKVP